MFVRPAMAQDIAATGEHRVDEVRAAADMLRRPVTVQVQHVSLSQAVDAAAASAKVLIQYRADLLEAYTTPVSVHVTNVPLSVVLDQIFAGTSLRVVAEGTTHLLVVDTDRERGASRAAGVLTGVVRDAKSKRPLRGVTVMLDDSVAVTRTNDAGRYRFAEVAAGTHRVTIRFIGYARQVQGVTVADEQSVTLDFALSSINTLDQVVVTATGEQSIRELGHVVTRINVDSLVKEAPVTNVTDLLTARVPGLVILTGNGGVAGQAVRLRLRGTTSMVLNAEPIVIVDGVRFRSTNAVSNIGTDLRADRAGIDVPSPLNDLNPNDIETIEIAKGPSASTLYGPDAANGVILITTKRGKIGKTQFNWYARPVANTVPEDRLPTKRYEAWGEDPVTHQPLEGVNCTLLAQYYYHQCILDSIVVIPTLIEDPRVSVIAKNRPTWLYGANVSGGSAALRYFASGNYDSEVGALRVSPAADSMLRAQYGLASIGDAVRTPNIYQALTVRSSVAIDVNPRATLNLSGNYAQTDNRRVSANIFNSQLNIVPGPGENADTALARFFIPDPTFSIQTTDEQSNRLNASVDGHDQLFPWLDLRGTVGIDIGTIVTHSVHPGGALGAHDDNSIAEDDRRNNTGRTVNLGGTAKGRVGIVTFRTSMGTQYTYTHVDGIGTVGRTLAPGSGSIVTATSV